MDTNIDASSTIIDEQYAPISARLPGEPDPDAHDPASLKPEAPHAVAPDPAAQVSGEKPAHEKIAVSSEKLPRKGPNVLLGGAAIVGIFVVIVAGVALWPRSEGPRVSGKSKSETLLAPAAALANVAVSPTPDSVIVPKYQPKSHDQEFNELLAMRSGQLGKAGMPSAARSGTPSLVAGAGTVAVRPPSGLPGQKTADLIPHEPGADLRTKAPGVADPASTPSGALPAPQGGPKDVRLASVEGLGWPPATTQAVGAPSPTVQPYRPAQPANATLAPAPGQAAPPAAASAAPVPAAPANTVTAPAPDAAGQAAQPGTRITREEETEDLELVNKLAADLRDLKRQSAAVRADVARMSDDYRARLADLTRRVAYAEANRGLTLEREAGKAEETVAAPAHTGTIIRPAKALTRAVAAPDNVAPSPAATADVQHYHVQAASPGLALLTETSRGGGEGAQIQVTVGDTLPGWGRVKSVGQRGTAWVVSTDRGVIE